MQNYFEQITEIHELLSGAGLDKQALEELNPQISGIASFLKIEHNEAVLLATAIREADGQPIKISDLQLFLGVSQREFMPWYPALDSLIRRGIAEIKESEYVDETGKKISTSPNRLIQIVPGVIHALKTGNRRLIFKQKAKTLGTFLLEFSRYYRERKKRFISLSAFLERVGSMCKGQKISVIRLLNKQELERIELALLLRMIQDFVMAESVSESDHFISDLMGDHPDLVIEWRAKFRSEKLAIFSKGLIESTELYEGYQVGNSRFNLSEQIISKLPFYDAQPKGFKSNLMRVTHPEKVMPVNLQFEPALRKQVNVLRRALEPEQFSRLQSRLSEQKMRNGLTIMLFGASGTGKTETAYQLARETGRVILDADASEIKGAMVGESEKSLRRLFAEYRRAKKLLPQVPILFFNEADALLQSRRKVIMGVDAHDNSLQNLLLQELEEFEGIFIATTNLIANIDSAFDRRFLYKIEYRQPGIETRTEILREKFERLDPAWLNKIAAVHKVTGAQIENVRRKLAIESVLDEDFTPTYECLDAMFAQESVRGVATRPNTVIGFKGSGTSAAA